MGGNWQIPVDTSHFFEYNNEKCAKIMTVKLLLLKSNEDVIADVSELVDELQRVIGYKLRNPYRVTLNKAEVLFENTTSSNKNVGITFFPCMPLSHDKEIPIPSDWVVTIVEPVKQLKESYVEKMNEKSKSDCSDESSNFAESN